MNKLFLLLCLLCFGCYTPFPSFNRDTRVTTLLVRNTTENEIILYVNEFRFASVRGGETCVRFPSYNLHNVRIGYKLLAQQPVYGPMVRLDDYAGWRVTIDAYTEAKLERDVYTLQPSLPCKL